MPTYQYECPACGVFEHHQGITEQKLETCLHCGSSDVSRLIGAGGGIIFKGGAPGQDERRAREDKSMFRKAQIARRQKYHGKVPMEETIKAKDVDLDHRDNNLANLRPIKGEKDDTNRLAAPPQGE